MVARYTGTAALTWAAINAYFATQDVHTWLHGLLLPLTQKAILHGQGLMGISYYFTAGSSNLDYYSYGSQLLLFGLLAATLLFVRRLGPAITVLPWLSFYLATRSQDGYFLMMTPLWLAAAATVPASAFASAWQPRIPHLTGHRAKAVLSAALVTPAVVCATVAAISAPPLRMNVTPSFAERAGHLDITGLAVRVVNITGTRLTPHFASRLGQGASNWWTASGGRDPRPARLRDVRREAPRRCPAGAGRVASALLSHRRDRYPDDHHQRTDSDQLTEFDVKGYPVNEKGPTGFSSEIVILRNHAREAGPLPRPTRHGRAPLAAASNGLNGPTVRGSAR